MIEFKNQENALEYDRQAIMFGFKIGVR
jgi:hypothetical protein